jgi:hypothetical protein
LGLVELCSIWALLAWSFAPKLVGLKKVTYLFGPNLCLVIIPIGAQLSYYVLHTSHKCLLRSLRSLRANACSSLRSYLIGLILLRFAAHIYSSLKLIVYCLPTTIELRSQEGVPSLYSLRSLSLRVCYCFAALIVTHLYCRFAPCTPCFALRNTILAVLILCLAHSYFVLVMSLSLLCAFAALIYHCIVSLRS